VSGDKTTYKGKFGGVYHVSFVFFYLCPHFLATSNDGESSDQHQTTLKDRMLLCH